MKLRFSEARIVAITRLKCGGAGVRNITTDWISALQRKVGPDVLPV